MAIDFRIRDFAHPLALARLYRELGAAARLEPAELAVRQARLLRATVSHAYARVPYYRQALDRAGVAPGSITRAADLEQLATIDRDTLRRSAAELRAREAWRHGPRAERTSGTSGAPVSFLLDRQANALELVHYWRAFGWAGYRLGDPLAELGAVHFLRRPARLGDDVHPQPHLRRLMLNGTMLDARRVRAMAEAIRFHRCRFLKGMASTLFWFVHCAEEAGAAGLSFEAVFSTGEVLTAAARRRIEQAFACPVLDMYGHMERTVAITQCLQGGYHVHTDYGVLELVADDGRRVVFDGSTPGGEGPSGPPRGLVGRVVGTTLHHRAMPLLRYRVGDLVETLSEARWCPCGLPFPRIARVLGRSEDVVLTPEGGYVTALFVLAELVEGVALAQFVQTARSHLLVRVVPGHRLDTAARQRLQRAVERLVGPGMRVEVRVVREEELERDASGKRPVVVSRVKPR